MAAVAITCVSILALFVQRKWRSSSNISEDSLLSNDDDLQKLIIKANKRAKNKELVVFYTHDFEKHKMAVETLCDFFKTAWDIGKVHYDLIYDADIMVQGSSWVEKMTRQKTNRHIVIVESEGAALQEKAKQDFKVWQPINGDHLDMVAPTAFELLKTDVRSLLDYKHLSVVKFEYTSDESFLESFVPNRRYRLPKHIFQLYCNILDLPKQTVDVTEKFREEMTRKWHNPLYMKLIPSINEATTEVEENPRLIRTCFLESFVQENE